MSNQTNQNQLSEATRKRLEAQSTDPMTSDYLNPTYLYSTTHTDLLLAIAGGLLDPLQLAREQLASRGLDADGRWVGFDRARQIWEVR